VKSETTSHMLQ